MSDEKIKSDFPEIQVAGEGDLCARFKTTEGEFVVRLEEHKAPNTVKNFVGLVLGAISSEDPKSGKKTQRPFYDDLVFHRVIAGFMIQGGCPLGRGTGGPGYRFADEFDRSLRHDRAGTLSMANSGPNTNGSQFFITDGATPHLDQHHSVFGYVISGQEVVHRIAHVPTDRHDRPQKDVRIEHIEIFRQ